MNSEVNVKDYYERKIMLLQDQLLQSIDDGAKFAALADSYKRQLEDVRSVTEEELDKNVEGG